MSSENFLPHLLCLTPASSPRNTILSLQSLWGSLSASSTMTVGTAIFAGGPESSCGQRLEDTEPCLRTSQNHVDARQNNMCIVFARGEQGQCLEYYYDLPERHRLVVASSSLNQHPPSLRGRVCVVSTTSSHCIADFKKRKNNENNTKSAKGTP